jgi:short-subunit dehydrogenase
MFSNNKLKDAVVVITGASSGIGRATALEFAKKGATLLLAARREDALNQVVEECREHGVEATAVPLDVTIEEDVKGLARRAIERYGRIDVWVNNAAVTLFARFEEAPSEVYRRVIDTNLFGYIHGARAALPYFREQGKGVLINVDSVVGEAAQPYTSAYVISKYGIRALGDCLRMELNLDGTHDIHVCTVMPPSVDTPLFQQGANYTGRTPKALEPVYSAETVAQAIVQLAQKPRREMIVGTAGKLMAMEAKYMPGFYERSGAKQIDQGHFMDKPAQPTPGNLWDPMPEYASVSGGWSQTAELPVRQILISGLMLVLGWFWLRPRLQERQQEPSKARMAWKRVQQATETVDFPWR